MQIGLRNDSVTLNYNWLATYDATAGGERAPIATIDPMSGDTIFGTAFYQLPVVYPSTNASVNEFSVQNVVPNPTTNVIHCYILASKHETVTIELCDNLGAPLRRESVVLEEGLQDIPVSTEDLASGSYWVVLRDEGGNQSLQKAILVH